jgi:hypothetical protein
MYRPKGITKEEVLAFYAPNPEGGLICQDIEVLSA